MLCWGSSLTRNLRVNNTLATRRSPIKITNPDGFAITFQYDEANRTMRAVDQEGNQVFTHRDVDGRPKCSKDPNGNSVFYTYWDHTRDSKLRRVTAPSANACPGLAPTAKVRAIEYDYDANGNVIQTLKPQRSATAPRLNRRAPMNSQ